MKTMICIVNYKDNVMYARAEATKPTRKEAMKSLKVWMKSEVLPADCKVHYYEYSGKISVGDRVISVCDGFGTVISVDGDEYEVQSDDGKVRYGSSDGISFAEPGILAWNERRNRWISNEESARYGKYLRRCYR